MYWIGKVFDLLLAEVGKIDRNLVLYFVIDNAGDINPARWRDLFQTGGGIDAFAKNVVFFKDDIAKIDADAVINRLFGFRQLVAPGELLLKRKGEGDGIGHTIEGTNRAIAGAFNNFAIMGVNARNEYVVINRHHRAMSGRLVTLHHGGVADNISNHDGGEPALTTSCGVCSDVNNIVGHMAQC
jgi:hypothetical protein